MIDTYLPVFGPGALHNFSQTYTLSGKNSGTHTKKAITCRHEEIQFKAFIIETITIIGTKLA